MPTTRHRIASAPRTMFRVALGCSLLIGCADRRPTAPEPSQLTGSLNGAFFALPGNATLLRRAGAPDTLVVSSWTQDLGISVQIEYRGPGTYALGPEQVEVLVLDGGDVRTGVYRGSVATPGELQILQARGQGAPFHAVLRFDAEHEEGERRLGPVARFRGVVLTTSLNVWRPLG